MGTGAKSAKRGERTKGQKNQSKKLAKFRLIPKRSKEK